MTEPQVWTVIGVLAATLASFVAAALTMITRTVNVQFERVSEKIDLKFDGLRGEMNARLDAMNTRLDALDRGFQALANRVWGGDRP